MKIRKTLPVRGPSSNAGMDDMGDNIYQDPTTTIETRKPTDPFGMMMYIKIPQLFSQLKNQMTDLVRILFIKIQH